MLKINLRLFRLLIYKHVLLPLAGCFIGAMDAADPAARSLLTIQKFFDGSHNSTYARFFLLGVFHPTNELISR